jgi:hypothetical protein
MHLVGEYVVGERVLAEGDEENLPPSIVIVGDAIESDGDEVLDVNDRQGLGVNGGVFGFKGVEGGLAFVVWTSLGPLPRWVPGPTTRWAPETTRLALHGT